MRPWLLILLAALAAAQDRPVVVEGVVVDSQTRVPLANVAVAVRYTKPPDGGRIMTAQNAQGAVTLTGPDGRFRLEEPGRLPRTGLRRAGTDLQRETAFPRRRGREGRNRAFDAGCGGPGAEVSGPIPSFDCAQV